MVDPPLCQRLNRSEALPARRHSRGAAPKSFSHLTHLECARCGRHHDADQINGVCTCGSPLLARYDLERVRAAVSPTDVAGRAPSLWRYHELLPVRDPDNVVTLGEGMTPLVPLPQFGKSIGVPRLVMKDEGLIPTGTFKARGAAAGVSRAVELGVRGVGPRPQHRDRAQVSRHGAGEGADPRYRRPHPVGPGDQAMTVVSRVRQIPIGVQVLAALIVGAALGLLSKPLGQQLKVLGDGFIRLIEMAIVPLIFPLIVLGVAKMESARRLGRIAAKTIGYFEIVTTVVLLMATVLALVTRVGSGASLSGAKGKAVHGVASSVDFKTLLLHIIPNNVFAAFSAGDLLAIVFFALFFGLAMARLGEQVAPLHAVLEATSSVMFTVVGYVVRFAPIGVFGYIAYDTAHYGLASLGLLAEFVGVVYLGMVIILAVVFPLVALIFRVSYLALLRTIWDLFVLAFITRSSEVVLAPLMQRLERHGADNSIVSFTLPIGYSFNLDGATLYEAIAVVFLAHAYGLNLSAGRLLTIIGLLLVLTKGLAGVPSAAIVVLLATAKAVGLPTEGVALLLGVDFIVDMARTAVNVVGNSLAAVVIAKSEGLFHPGEAADAVRAPRGREVALGPTGPRE